MRSYTAGRWSAVSGIALALVVYKTDSFNTAVALAVWCFLYFVVAMLHATDLSLTGIIQR